MNGHLAGAGACDVRGGSAALRVGACAWLLQVLVMSLAAEQAGTWFVLLLMLSLVAKELTGQENSPGL